MTVKYESLEGMGKRLNERDEENKKLMAMNEHLFNERKTLFDANVALHASIKELEETNALLIDRFEDEERLRKQYQQEYLKQSQQVADLEEAMRTADPTNKLLEDTCPDCGGEIANIDGWERCEECGYAEEL